MGVPRNRNTYLQLCVTMIERKYLSENLELITSNEPFVEMDRILEIASKDDSHPLYKNYTDVRLTDFVFVNVILTDGVPSLFYGLQQKDWMDGAARAYTRMYRPPGSRGVLRDSCVIVDNAGYQHLTKWWQPVTDTLFITRNVADKRDTLMQIARAKVRDQSTAIGATVTNWNKYWKQYPFVCNINGVDQYVYTMGEHSVDFLKERHMYMCTD